MLVFYNVSCYHVSSSGIGDAARCCMIPRAPLVSAPIKSYHTVTDDGAVMQRSKTFKRCRCHRHVLLSSHSSVVTLVPAGEPLSLGMISDANPQSIFGRGGNELLWESVQDHAPVTAKVADQVSTRIRVIDIPLRGESYKSYLRCFCLLDVTVQCLGVVHPTGTRHRCVCKR